MSLRNYFNKKSRAAAAAAALTLAAGGGIVGMEAGNTYHQPGMSNITLSHAPKDITEEQFYYGKVKNWQPDANELKARADFTQRIDVMAAEMKAGASGSVFTHAISFVNDLRTSENISEQDYAALLKDYNKRVGLDVTALAGNYREGIAFNQECQVGAAIGNLFGGDDDETKPSDIGACMLDAQHERSAAALEGGAAGFALGAMLGVPLWRRRRNQGPKQSGT